MNLYPFGKAVTYLLVRALFRMRYEGLEYIPQQGGYIIACNHRSNFDPLFIAHRLSRQIHYMAKAELTQNPFLAALFRSLGIVPIARGAGDSSAIDRSAELIRDGEVLGIFPEGHRSKDGKPLRPRSGISVIAGRTGAGILPCAVVFDKLRFRAPVTVRYGPLISFEELGVDLDSPSSLRAASKLVMDRIVSLMGREA